MLPFEGELTVSETAERLGVARSTARRLLSMRRSGFARNQGRSGRQVM
ncbi:excisionase family DNA-binding protein, partial [Streptomyces sp. NPDC002596]